MAEQLARIDWKLGQTLLPEHFFAQEEALLLDVASRMKLMGRPFYGVGRLQWNDALLQEGILSIAAATIVLPTGQLLDLPGNVDCQRFNLTIPGTTKVVVYLHLTSERAEADAGAEAAKSSALDGEAIERVMHRVVLSADQGHKTAVFTMKLAEFEKDIEGAWSLSEDFVPSLLQVGTSPFLSRPVARLMKQVQLFHKKLEEDIGASYLGGEGLFGAKLCLKGIYAFQRTVANMGAQIKMHPYDFFEALRTFYIDVCIYREAVPVDVLVPYQHDDIAACFRRVLKPLLELLQVTKGKTPYLTFERKDGVYQLAEFPGELRTAKEVYFLLQKPKVSETVSLQGFKIASKTRLPTVHQLSLIGVPMKRIERPPFTHHFGAEVEFYLLAPGEEWDQVLREGSIAYFDTPVMAKSKAYIYWRSA
jgi:type VI secretion system protein ImpJ